VSDSPNGIQIVTRKPKASTHHVRAAQHVTGIRANSTSRRASGIAVSHAKRGYRPDLRSVSHVLAMHGFLYYYYYFISYIFVLSPFHLFFPLHGGPKTRRTASTLEPTLPPSLEGRDDRLGVDKNARTTQPPAWNDQTSCWWCFAPRRYRMSSFTLPWRWPTLRRRHSLISHYCFSISLSSLFHLFFFLLRFSALYADR
jgi:hypothetical protein